MTLHPDNLPDLIDAYLDGRLNDQQRTELENMAKTDPSVGLELENAMAAEDRLRSLFSVPACADLIPASMQPPAPIRFPGDAVTAPVPSAPAPESKGQPAVSRRIDRRPLILAAAAVLVIAGGVGAYLWTQRVHPAPAPITPTAALSPGELYANLLKRKFKPTFICENDEQFAKFLGDRFGSGAVLASADGVQVLGWAYADGMLGEATAVIMARVDNKEEILVVDEKKYDKHMPDAGPGLNMFRSECNGLVFYEITPLADARLTPLIKAAPPLHLKSD